MNKQERDVLKIASAILSALLCVPSMAQADDVYRCTLADRSILLTDRACPAGTVSREYVGESRPPDAAAANSDNPWSVMAQARRIEERERAQREAAAARRAAAEQARAAPPSAAPESAPPISYDAAKAAAMRATGYQDYDVLTGSQRARVHEEMAKYNYLPPEDDTQ